MVPPTWVLLTVVLAAGGAQPPDPASIAALEAEGRDAEALAAADALVRDQPGWELPRLDAARLRLKLGEDLGRAEGDLLAAQAIAPENPRGHFLMGLLHEERSREDRAREARAVESYRTALVYRPHYDEARSRLAGLLYARGELEAAEREYRILSERQPDELGPRLQLASVLERMGRDEEAERILLALWESDRRPVVAGRRLLALYERTEQREKAKRLRAVIEGPAPQKQHRPLKPSRR